MLAVLLLLFVISLLLNFMVMFLASFQLFLFDRPRDESHTNSAVQYNLCISLVSSLLQAGFGFDSKLLLSTAAPARQMVMPMVKIVS